MPQLDFSVFPSQLFWLCISFFTMLFIMSKLIIPRIAEMINLRQEKIDGDLEKAAQIKTRAEAALDKYHEALAKATNEANQSLQKTQQELKNMIERREAELTNELNRQIADGEQKIKSGRDKAVKQVQGIAADLAWDILKKLNFKDIKIKDIEAAVAEAGKK